MTWRILSYDPPSHILLECACGTQKRTKRWNYESGQTKRCQRCHLVLARKRSSLTTEQRNEIIASTEKTRVLAARYGVSASTIHRIRKP